MYTIRHAAALAGVSVELLRAWERRYGVVAPLRTAAGYRLYDDEAIDRLRAMRRLVDSGWSARTAAEAIVSGEAAPLERANDADGAGLAGYTDTKAQLIERFVTAAQGLDGSAVSSALDEMVASGSYERTLSELILPAMHKVGDEWAAGRLTVAAEHAASNAVLRRLGAAFEAAGTEPSIERAVVFALPPGCQHELGLLAFAVSCRRAGIPAVYVGANLPREDWLNAAASARAVVIGVASRSDRNAAAKLGRELAQVRPGAVIALGGPAAPTVDGCLTLSTDMKEAVVQLQAALR